MKFRTVLKVMNAVGEMLEDERWRAQPEAQKPPTAETHYDGSPGDRGEAANGPAPPYLVQMLIAHMRSLIQGMTPK